MPKRRFCAALQRYAPSILMLAVFETVGVALWLAKGNLFYLGNFSYIGASIALGLFLFERKARWARRVVQFLVGAYMLVFLGLYRRENMQIEGFWYYLFLGVFEAATIHYAVAKIFGPLPKKDWAATGWDGKSRPRAVINSLYIEADRCEELNLALKKQYEEIAKNECMVEEQYMDDAEYVIAAYGTTARIALTAIRQARVKAGLIRPITLWPFPSEAFARAAQKAKKFLTVEMSLGQMVDDVRIAVNGARPVEFYGRTGGVIPGVGEITRQILKLAGREG